MNRINNWWTKFLDMITTTCKIRIVYHGEIYEPTSWYYFQQKNLKHYTFMDYSTFSLFLLNMTLLTHTWISKWGCKSKIKHLKDQTISNDSMHIWILPRHTMRWDRDLSCSIAEVIQIIAHKSIHTIIYYPLHCAMPKSESKQNLMRRWHKVKF